MNKSSFLDSELEDFETFTKNFGDFENFENRKKSKKMVKGSGLRTDRSTKPSSGRQWIQNDQENSRKHENSKNLKNLKKDRFNTKLIKMLSQEPNNEIISFQQLNFQKFQQNLNSEKSSKFEISETSEYRPYNFNTESNDESSTQKSFFKLDTFQKETGSDEEKVRNKESIGVFGRKNRPKMARKGSRNGSKTSRSKRLGVCDRVVGRLYTPRNARRKKNTLVVEKVGFNYN